MDDFVLKANRLTCTRFPSREALVSLLDELHNDADRLGATAHRYLDIFKACSVSYQRLLHHDPKDSL